jgi:hypothetical protein
MTSFYAPGRALLGDRLASSGCAAPGGSPSGGGTMAIVVTAPAGATSMQR